MEKEKAVACPENEELATYMWRKRQEIAERGISENLDMTLSKAYSNVCKSKTAITSLKDFSQIKGVGKWILRLLKGFFETNSGTSEPEELTKKGKKTNGTKRYVPQKNSVPYALLITLYNATRNGRDYMHKQELIDAAEASGLSRAAIGPELGKGKLGHFGSSPREWYSGWSSMKTLITKGLVVKSSSPAKYMLTPEGLEAARECLARSGSVNPVGKLVPTEGVLNLDVCNVSDAEFASSSAKEMSVQSTGLCRQKKDVDVPLEYVKRFTDMGYSKEQVLRIFTEVCESSQNKAVSSLWPTILCRLREDQIYGLNSEPQSLREDHLAASSRIDLAIRGNNWRDTCEGADRPKSSYSADSTQRSCSLSDYPMQKLTSAGLEANMNALTMPPLTFGERFEDAYEVILILDDREQFAAQGSRSRKIVENIRTQFKIQIEVRRLPVGDGIWIARHKHLDSEYVLDFIVERKKIDDLRSSIRDSRYKDQKQRLLRCGLKKLIYLVEGDPNCSEAAETIKTACFTTEILEGFDVQRTSGLGDTLRKYGYLTQAITQYYNSPPEDQVKNTCVCLPYDEFVSRCQNLEKMTVSDVFAVQLMQVPQVTEEVAIAVLDLYPTPLSLARAYSLLEGDVSGQEEMLRRQSNNMVSAFASKNIFQFVWGN